MAEHRGSGADESGDPTLVSPADLDALARTDTLDSADSVLPARAQTSPPSHVSPGARINQYEVIRLIGSGGMGDVVLARDTKLGRKVAIKLMRRMSAHGKDRFGREARATARCNHENIVVIHEVNEVDGTPYMVLEYLHGKPLSELASQGPIPAHRAIEILVSVTRALHHAHALGLVHRDLKPENVFLTSTGVIKVLDFGIAKAYLSPERPALDLDELADTESLSETLTQDNAIVGTLPYMSPEQLGADDIDHRSDIWAVGIMAFEMLAGHHPLTPYTAKRAIEVRRLQQPMPTIAEQVHGLAPDLVAIVDRCLAKRKQDRFTDAGALLAELEALLPGRPVALDTDANPYPGLVAFQEGDADRFFGRGREVAQMVAWIRERPLTAVAGQSGAGKSSFVRAGVVPALKASDDVWEVFSLRPGRDPMAALAGVLAPLSRTDASGSLAEHDELVSRLRDEPGYLGASLRRRCRERGTRALLYVDQFEELYTLVPDVAERHAFTRCLSGVADDSSTPLRVVISIRSDFLDRVAEDRRFVDDLTRGLFFLPPPDRDGLRAAIVEPARMAGFELETSAMVDDMLDVLDDTPGALPLLQFAAATLWDERDREAQLITSASYEALGGIEGALAAHADQVMSVLSPAKRTLAREIFLRLVTPERTRALVGERELTALRDDPADVSQLLTHLVEARLLLVQTGDETDGALVELVHESLIASWPTLQRWLDESAEDAAFLSELRTVARQWQQRDRPSGLLWRGESAQDAQRWRARSNAVLTRDERAYLDAVDELHSGAARRRRIAVVATIVLLAVLAAAAAAALVVIRGSQQRAERESAAAKRAKQRVADQLEQLQAKERARQRAERNARTATTKATKATAEVAQTKDQLRAANARLRRALDDANAATVQARKESERAQRNAERAKKMSELANQQKKRAEELAEKRRRQLEAERKKLRKYTGGDDL